MSVLRCACARRGMARACALMGLVVGLNAAWLVIGCEGRRPSTAAESVKSTEVSGREIWMRVSLDHERLTTAERLTVWLEVAGRAGSQLEVSLDDGVFAGWRVVERWSSAAELNSSTGRAERTFRVVLDPFLPGKYTVPSIEVVARDLEGAGGVERVRSAEIGVEVSSALAGGAKTDDVPPTMEYEPRAGRRANAALLIAGCVGSVAAMGVVAWIVVRRRGRLSAPMDERALRALVLGRAVERGEFGEITPDLVARVLSESGPIGGEDREEARRLMDRVDGWRFGGVAFSVSELGEAARSVVGLMARVGAGAGLDDGAGSSMRGTA